MTSQSPVEVDSSKKALGDKQSLFGVLVTIQTNEQILQYIQKSLGVFGKNTSERNKKANWQLKSVSATSSEHKPIIVFTPNPEQVVFARKHPWYTHIINSADIAVPDGVGIVWAMKLRHQIRIERIPGVELMGDLLTLAVENGLSVAFLGGSTVDLALEEAKQLHPGLKGWSRELPILNVTEVTEGKGVIWELKTEKGSLDDLVGTLCKKIIETKTSIVFVGLGAPKQEMLISKLSALSPQLSAPLVFMAVGGSFDILAGKTPRAPKLIRRFGIEWLWRLVIEPWRIKRQLALIQFVFLGIMDRINRIV